MKFFIDTANVEDIRKANEMGAFTIALTNNGESAVAKEAKRSFVLNTPKMQDDFPGLRSYFASMIGLIAIACRMGRVRNVLPPNSEKRLAESLKAYVHRYAEVLSHTRRNQARAWLQHHRRALAARRGRLKRAVPGHRERRRF